MTQYAVLDRATYLALEADAFGSVCAERGVRAEDVARGAATLDTLNGEPVFPPISTGALPAIALDLQTVAVGVSAGVRELDGKLPPGKQVPIDFKQAVDLAFVEKRWADLIDLKRREGFLP